MVEELWGPSFTRRPSAILSFRDESLGDWFAHNHLEAVDKNVRVESEYCLAGQTAVRSDGGRIPGSRVESSRGRSIYPQRVFQQSFDSALFLQPWNPRLMKTIFSNDHNFRPQSNIQVLQVDNDGTFWRPEVSDAAINQFLVRDVSTQSARPQHTLITFFVYLEFKHEAQYKRQASISRESLKQLVGHIGMHDAAVQDLLGRPDYWSAFGRRKGGAAIKSADYEFFCQHPRWLQKSRYDKLQHRAPCSVYMHHDTAQNTSYYVVSAAQNDSCATEILEELGIPDPGVPYAGPTVKAAANPFLIHALVSGYAYHQSIDYLTNVRERLFSEIAEVNDYSKESHASLPQDGQGKDAAGRKKLENITKNLHLVSQTCDTGIANADMSISLCEEMLKAHATFCGGATAALLPESWRQVQDSMEWILKTWHCQKNWLVSYKARKDTAMNFVYNLVTQQDNSLNIDIAHQAAQHSSSMNAITILTMLFLPGTFIAAVFGSGILNGKDSHGISDIFWPFIYTVVPLTLITGALWFWRRQLEKSYWNGRRKLRGRQKRTTGLGDDDVEIGIGIVERKS